MDNDKIRVLRKILIRTFFLYFDADQLSFVTVLVHAVHIHSYGGLEVQIQAKPEDLKRTAGCCRSMATDLLREKQQKRAISREFKNRISPVKA